MLSRPIDFEKATLKYHTIKKSKFDRNIEISPIDTPKYYKKYADYIIKKRKYKSNYFLEDSVVVLKDSAGNTIVNRYQFVKPKNQKTFMIESALSISLNTIAFILLIVNLATGQSGFLIAGLIALILGFILNIIAVRKKSDEPYKYSGVGYAIVGIARWITFITSLFLLAVTFSYLI
jgi:hypothetical protein